MVRLQDASLRAIWPVHDATTGNTDDDQVDRHDVIQGLRKDQDQNAGNQRDDRRDVGNGKHSEGSLIMN
jgi:hypothetical protein